MSKRTIIKSWSLLLTPTTSTIILTFPILLTLYKCSQPYLGDSRVIENLFHYYTIVIALKLIYSLKRRYERLKLFDECHIPSVGNKNIISGNLFEVIIPGDNLKIIHEYHARLGKTFGLFYGPDPWIFTTDLDLLQKIFVTDGFKYSDITQFRMPFIEEMNISLSQVTGEDWRRIRRVLNPSFTLKQMKSDNVHANMSSACDKLIECLKGYPTSEGYRVVDMAYNMKKFSIDVIFEVAYGRSGCVNMEPGEPDELIELCHRGSKLISSPVSWASIMLDSSMHQILGLLSKFTAIQTSIDFIHATMASSLSERRRIGRRILHSERKMIDSIMEAANANKISSSVLRANLFFIFIAGFETTSNTAAILCWHLAKRQDIQEKLRSSLLVDGEDSRYLECCINETLRLYPAVPTAIGRVVPDELGFDFNGMRFEPGVTINASIWSIHHSAELWGQDVESFRPERFEEPLKHPLQYFAFAHGPRHCIGAKLATIELKAIVLRLLLKFRLEPCESTPERLDVSSPNLIHMLIEEPIDLRLLELSCL